MRLVQGYYGNQFANKGNLFSLRCGQMRTNTSVVHNGGWYNCLGEKIGWGDLNRKDLENIANNLESDEAFIVLPEQASFWKFVKQPAVTGCLSVVDVKEQNPGLAYVCEHFRYAIFPKRIYFGSWFNGGVDRGEISSEQLLEKLKALTEPK